MRGLTHFSQRAGDRNRGTPEYVTLKVAAGMAADVKDRLVEEFMDSNAKSVTEEHTQLAKEYLRLQGDRYTLDLEVIKLDELLQLNNVRVLI